MHTSVEEHGPLDLLVSFAVGTLLALPIAPRLAAALVALSGRNSIGSRDILRESVLLCHPNPSQSALLALLFCLLHGIRSQWRYHPDHLGSPRILTNHLGNKVSDHHYYPYGAEFLPSGQTQPDDPAHKFTGHERDASGVMDYMLGRTYVFPLGRFASVDPARDGWNLYGYVGGNPINATDPTGLADRRSDEDIALLEDPEVLRANSLIISNTQFEKPFSDRVEYGTVVTVDDQQDFDTTPVTTSGSQTHVDFALKDQDGELVTPEGHQIAATIHSHVGTGRTNPGNPLSDRLVGGRSSGSCGKNQCNGDKELARVTGKPVYILNAKDSLIKYDPQVGKDQVILSGADYDAYIERAHQTQGAQK